MFGQEMYGLVDTGAEMDFTFEMSALKQYASHKENSRQHITERSTI